MPEETALSPESPISIEISRNVHAELSRRAAESGAALGIGELLERLYDPERVEIDSMEALGAIANAPRNRIFDIAGKKLSCIVRPLTSTESTEIDRIINAVIPPKDANGMPNEKDPQYIAARTVARRTQQAAAFDLCIPKLKIPGANPQQKAEWMGKNLPPGVIDELWASIYEITANPVEHALFT